MKKPKTLDGYAEQFWEDNYKLCKDNKTLLPETLSAFILLCRIYARYMQAEDEGIDTIKIVALHKQVTQGMKDFGMTPASRKRLGLTETESLADVLGKITRGTGAVQTEES